MTKKVIFPRDYMLSVLEGDEGEIISDEITDHSRWSVSHTLIWKRNNHEVYSCYYSIGATEYQDESPWEYEKEVECYPMRLVTKTIEVWKKIND